MLIRSLAIVLLFIAGMQSSAADNIEANTFELTLNSDEVISIKQFGADGDRVLWIPSEYGINKERYYELLHSFAGLHYQIWLAELHESYFIPPGRSSYTRVPVDDISELIEKSLPEGKQKLFIIASGRGAVLSLLAINNWLTKTDRSENFGGIIMLHPNFQATTPTPGTAMEFLPVVDATQLPMFIIQPKMSNKYWYLDDLVTRLSNSGSQVYTQVIEQAGDGYHSRPGSSDIEKQKARELPLQLSRAIRVLAQTKINRQVSKDIPEVPWQVASIAESLQPYPDNTSAPALELHDMQGEKYRLHDLRGKVILLNFWASWCPPCVKEIPSLNRLQKMFPKNELLILSVDIGESKKQVEAFLTEVPADFPVLMDPDGNTVKQWKIIAFPTSFIIDKQGVIKLAYFGGLEWDTPQVVTQIQALIDNI